MIEKAIILYRERFSTVGLFENFLYPQIPEILQAIRSAGYQTYVATSKPHIFANRIIEHFGLTFLFDGIYGSELDGTRCDKAELLRYILISENLIPAKTVMVGDRSHDIIGAKKNQILAIGVTYGYGTREEYDKVIQQVILFLEGKHDEVVKHLQEQMQDCLLYTSPSPRD